MPRLWTDTVAAHRREVRRAILETTARLAAEHGVTAVTMSRIAAGTGIGRATLYKYFPDVEAVLVAWHEQHVADHLARVADARDGARAPGERLDAVLRVYALVVHERARRHGGSELAALLHRDEHVAPARRQLRELLRDVLAEAASAGSVRHDVAPDELAGFCLHALGAAGELPDEEAVGRLVALTGDALRPRG